MSNQKLVAVVQMITHMKEVGPDRTEVFMVGGKSVVVQGAVDDLDAAVWP